MELIFSNFSKTFFVAELFLGTIIYKFLASIVIYGVLRPTWLRIRDKTIVSLRQSFSLAIITLLCLVVGGVFFYFLEDVLACIKNHLASVNFLWAK